MNWLNTKQPPEQGPRLVLFADYAHRADGTEMDPSEYDLVHVMDADGGTHDHAVPRGTVDRQRSYLQNPVR